MAAAVTFFARRSVVKIFPCFWDKVGQVERRFCLVVQQLRMILHSWVALCVPSAYLRTMQVNLNPSYEEVYSDNAHIFKFHKELAAWFETQRKIGFGLSAVVVASLVS